MYKFLHLLLGYIQTRLIIKSVLVRRDKNARGKEKLFFSRMVSVLLVAFEPFDQM